MYLLTLKPTVTTLITTRSPSWCLIPSTSFVENVIISDVTGIHSLSMDMTIYDVECIPTFKRLQALGYQLLLRWFPYEIDHVLGLFLSTPYLPDFGIVDDISSSVREGFTFSLSVHSDHRYTLSNNPSRLASRSWFLNSYISLFRDP